LGGVAYAFFGGSGGVAGPQVSGLPVKQATEQVTTAGLVPKEIDRASATVQKGIVISTDPANGSLVARGTTVTLFVSSGAPKVEVPDVVHQSDTNARNTLQNAGFQVREQTAQNSTAPPNTVVRQDPTAGTRGNKGATGTSFRSARRAQGPNGIRPPVDAAAAHPRAPGLPKHH